jgi:hypothetical protein
MNKLIRDGKVAVLISPDYGAGWYTWNTEYPECLYDPEIVKIVLNEAKGNICEIANNKFGEGFTAYDSDQLVVVWVPVGSRFRINEFDGSESLILEEDDNWLTAEAE